MIKSMTGFGRAEANINGMKYNIEIRSVNHRYFETMFKMPKELLLLEDRFKKIIQNYIKRGRVDIFITIDTDDQAKTNVAIDWKIAEGYVQLIHEMKSRFDLRGDIEVKDLLSIPELFQNGASILELEDISEGLLSALESAVQLLIEMRIKEGIALQQDIIQRLDTLKQQLVQVEERAPLVVDDYRKKLKSRISEWLTDVVEIDESKLLNEVAFFSEKANVDEEITRLKSHFQQFSSILEQEEPIGRKLDFLIQELNREINTIGSKANDLYISKHVVDMKSEIEKIREQVQNVE